MYVIDLAGYLLTREYHFESDFEFIEKELGDRSQKTEVRRTSTTPCQPPTHGTRIPISLYSHLFSPPS